VSVKSRILFESNVSVWKKRLLLTNLNKFVDLRLLFSVSEGLPVLLRPTFRSVLSWNLEACRLHWKWMVVSS